MEVQEGTKRELEQVYASLRGAEERTIQANSAQNAIQRRLTETLRLEQKAKSEYDEGMQKTTDLEDRVAGLEERAVAPASTDERSDEDCKPFSTNVKEMTEMWEAKRRMQEVHEECKVWSMRVKGIKEEKKVVGK